MGCGRVVELQLCDVGKLGDLSGPLLFILIVIAMTPASQGCARLIRESRAPGWMNEGITPAAECGLMTVIPTS